MIGRTRPAGAPRAGRAAALAAACLVLPILPAAPVSGQDGLLPGRRAPGEWPSHAGDLTAARYSPLDQIDASNVAELEIAWRWTSRNFGARPEGEFRGSPLMVDGVLYTTAGYRRAAVAIDPGTGETLWMHRMDEGERGRRGPRVNSGRGVAWWDPGTGEAPRIVYITPGYHMVALDAATGLPVPTFGADGAVDLMGTLRPRDGIDPVGAIGSSSPPLVVGDVLVVGSALHVGTAPPSRVNVPGDVRGFDARTGELLWRFHVIPEPEEPGAETWREGSHRYTGNGGVWTTMSADRELGLVYLPTEAPTHDYYGGHRPGDNLYTSSLVALDVATGARRWHFQLVHHDVWDYDAPAAPILADLVVDSEEVRAVAQITKQGWVYVFDRATGEPVWPIEERAVPPSDVPGERTSPTQPVPTKPPPFTRQGVTEADAVDFTPELRARALEALAGLKTGPVFTPLVVGGTAGGPAALLMLPGSTGGGNWEGGSYDPTTGLLYVASKTSPSPLALFPSSEGSDVDYVGRFVLPDWEHDIPLLKPPYGQITAIDLNRGEIAWQMANADTPEEVESHPLLEGIELPRTGRPALSGLLATATLLFSGEGRGGRPVLRAHDKASGEIVAELDLPATQTGMPMSYMWEGKQYVVVPVGDRETPAELVAFRLP